jgi:hypothetical protein
MFVANDPDPIEAFYLIVADHNRRVFAVEGPMTDDRPWEAAAKSARSDAARITCGPRGTDRDTLAAEFRRAHNFAGVPPGSILRAIG